MYYLKEWRGKVLRDLKTKAKKEVKAIAFKNFEKVFERVVG